MASWAAFLERPLPLTCKLPHPAVPTGVCEATSRCPPHLGERDRLVLCRVHLSRHSSCGRAARGFASPKPQAENGFSFRRAALQVGPLPPECVWQRRGTHRALWLLVRTMLLSSSFLSWQTQLGEETGVRARFSVGQEPSDGQHCPPRSRKGGVCCVSWPNSYQLQTPAARLETHCGAVNGQRCAGTLTPPPGHERPCDQPLYWLLIPPPSR